MIAWLFGRWTRRFAGPPAELVADGEGVSLLRDGLPALRFHWAEVAEIRTYKADLGVVDDIRLAFLAGGSWHEFGEDTPGFRRLTEAMAEAFPTIPADWLRDVMFPAFATNERTLYRRSPGPGGPTEEGR